MLDEVDYEAQALFDTILFTCISCGMIDMKGMAVVEEFNGQFVMTGVLCQACVRDKFITVK